MDLFPESVLALARATVAELRTAGKRIATAESCTGGLIAGAITEIAGSSDVLGRGFVTYSNEGKRDMLGVRPETLQEHGAVSEPTVREMVSGALAAAGPDADYAVAVSGVAGPGGGSAEKPVGTVWVALGARDGETVARRFLFEGDRTAVRVRTVEAALELLRSRLA